MTAAAPEGLLDPAIARATLADPDTGPNELSVIAQHHPALRAEVAMHPAAYPGLLDWLDALGDPLLSAVVSTRRGPAGPAAQASASAGVGWAPAATLGNAWATDPAASPWAAQQTVGPAASAGSAATQPVPAKPAPRKLLIALGAAALAVALVITGFATRGFGLFPAGGAATPEAEAAKVADKTVQLLNSFSAKNLLSNPLSSMGSLSDEYAPSEARLSAPSSLGTAAGNPVLDATDLLGLTGDTVALATDLAGSFQVQATDLKTEVTELTDDIAMVSYVDGTVTVNADTGKLREALTKAPDVLAKQLTTTAEKYGLHPVQVDIANELPAGWVDDAVKEAEDRFPVTIDLAEYDRWLHGGPEPESVGVAGLYRAYSGVVVVKEAGRWYLSPMLTSAAWSSGSFANPDGLKLDADDRRLFSVEPSKNQTPADAAAAMAKAIGSARERAVLAELPLAERRYAAFTAIGENQGILGALASAPVGERPSVEVAEIARNGDRALLRIEEYDPILITNDQPVAIEDGSCVRANGETACLADYLDAGRVTDAIDALRGAPWDGFEDATGINPDDLLDRVETAAVKAVAAVDPARLGIVTVQEDGGWFVSASATIGELQSQAMSAVVTGLKAAQQR